MDSFFRLCKTRAQGFNGPANLSLGDITAIWAIDGWRDGEMTIKEFLEYMLGLDAAYCEFAKRANKTTH